MNVEEAQLRICAILAELEGSTGQIVRSLEIYDIDLTTYGDERRQLMRNVIIELTDIPGTRWAK